MNLLALETTGSEASVALLQNDGAVTALSSPEKMNHLRGLMPMLAELLEKCKLTLNDVDVIAVSQGPGSFTGIRIGVATARALAQALGLKTVGVPTLKTFAYLLADYEGIICPIFDARRNQVYGGAYRWEDGRHCRELIAGGAYEIGELLQGLEKVFRADALPQSAQNSQSTQSLRIARNSQHLQIAKVARRVLFCGDGIAPYEKAIAAWRLKLQESSSFDDIRIDLAKEEQRYQNAAGVAKLGYELYLEGNATSYEELKPVYMRKAEAERKLEEKASQELNL